MEWGLGLRTLMVEVSVLDACVWLRSAKQLVCRGGTKVMVGLSAGISVSPETVR